ncbi:tail fiber domain-containing protein [Chryseobacterium sp. JUb7]|uniref:tail fiber domain-containing protein n=1 Tax=Chryseobacterium sp. JUb7 TaxID=2940599 RepID=UPI00216758CF|nr:tail fiber domain-containing protein [Chryseobacterium sp. JUb7]MCS3530017.1 hypothetical protein [Chryseobacterium sp. JUb7]
MKKVILSSLLLLGAYSFAQVGVNTNTPSSTLDITAKNATGTTDNVDGLLVPRVDRQRAQSMTTIPTSTIIYVNSIATGAATGIATNIDAVGYYFYNGTTWIKMPVNIYNSDGTLTGNRTVTQGANTLAFTGTAVNAFSVDGTSLSVDATNHRVGIGTNSPDGPLHIVSTGSNALINERFATGTGSPAYLALRRNGATAIGSNAAVQSGYYLGAITFNGNSGTGYTTNAINGNSMVVSSATENYTATAQGSNLSFWTVPSGTTTNVQAMIITDTGNVGIATASPQTKLDVQTPTQQYGFQHTDGAVRVRSYIGIGNNAGAGLSGWLGTNSNHPLDLMTNDLFRMRITTSGNVGINTVAPTSTLSVNGSADKPGGGSWGTFSDKRVKKEIVEFRDGLNVITQLRPVTYKYNEKSGYKDLDKQYVGFIAQEVEKAAPYMVNIIDDSAKSGLKDKRELDESALTKILVNAVREQQKEIEDLKLQVKEMQKLLKK